MKVAITGAWSYSGRPLAAALREAGHEVLSLTNRAASAPAAPPRAPYGDFSVPHLARALAGADALHCGYWVRHDRAPVGHRGPWTSHEEAVRRSASLVEAARRAGVRRLVWTSITNPGLDADLSYFAGKAQVEALVRCSGIPYAILRPACFFGRGGILLENVAWAARRLPWIPIPAGPPYFIRPIHVDDYAALAAAALGSGESWTRDAAGPDRFEFGELVREVAAAVGGPGRPARVPIRACRALYAAASVAARETILTPDELRGLARNRLDSTGAPLGTTSLQAWLHAHAGGLGTHLAREPRRSKGP